MFWEIIELEDGQIALKAGDSDREPLVIIGFSEEAKDQMKRQHVEIAKAMISAGMALAHQIEEEGEEGEYEEEASTLH